MIAKAENDPSTDQLIKDLKTAYNACWDAKIKAYETAKKYAPLCLQIVQRLGDVPKLANNRIEQRRQELDGCGALLEDFWAHEDMVIALYRHVESEFNLPEVENA